MWVFYLPIPTLKHFNIYWNVERHETAHAPFKPTTKRHSPGITTLVIDHLLSWLTLLTPSLAGGLFEEATVPEMILGLAVIQQC